MAVDGITATYIAANQFSVTGNQTTDFHAGRRVKAALTGGNVYSTISGSVFGAVTTVTLYDSELDNTLTKVWYGIGWGSEGSLPDHTHDGSEGSGGFLTLSGTSGDYLARDGSTQLTGDWDFGSFTISGTGDIIGNFLSARASAYFGYNHSVEGNLLVAATTGVYNAGHLDLVDTANDIIWQITNRAGSSNSLEIHNYDGSSWYGPYLKYTTDGSMIIGESIDGFSGGPTLIIVSESSSTFNIYRYVDSSAGSAPAMYKARGSVSIPSAVIAGDVVAGYNAFAYDGSTMDDIGRVRHRVESISSGNVKSYIEFDISDSGGSTSTMARINSTGLIVGDAIDQQADYAFHVLDSWAIISLDGSSSTSDSGIRLEKQGTPYWHIWSDADQSNRLVVGAEGSSFHSIVISNTYGSLGIGYTGNNQPTDATRLTIKSEDSGVLTLFQYSDGSGGAAFSGNKSRGGDQDSPTAVQAADVVTGYNANAYDGSAFDTIGRCRHLVEAISTGNVAGYWELQTSDTAGICRQVTRIDSEGRYWIAAEDIDTILTDWQTHIPSSIGQINIIDVLDNRRPMTIMAFNTGSGGPAFNIYKARGNSVSSPTAVVAEDTLAGFNISAYDGSTFDFVVNEKYRVEAINAGNVAAYYNLQLSDTSGTLRDVLRVHSSGRLELYEDGVTITNSGTVGIPDHQNLIMLASGIVYVDGDLDVYGHMAIGSDANIDYPGFPTLEYLLNINETFDPSIIYAYGINLYARGAANSGSATIRGISSSAVHTGTGQFSEIRGIYSAAYTDTAGAAGTNIRGIYSSAYIGGDNTTVTNIIGGYFTAGAVFGMTNASGINVSAGQFRPLAGGTGDFSSDNVYGVQIMQPGASYNGTLTNLYGLYIEDMGGSSMSFTNEYNIYSAGATSKNYFEGDIYCNDIFTASGTVWVGNVQLSNPSPGILDFGGATLQNAEGLGVGGGAASGGNWTLIDETTVSGSTLDWTVSGTINGDMDEKYYFDFYFDDMSGSTNWLGVQFNNDTGSNYRFVQHNYGVNHNDNTPINYDSLRMSVVAGNGTSTGYGYLNPFSGRERSYIGFANRETEDYGQDYGAWWENTADNITSIKVISTGNCSAKVKIYKWSTTASGTGASTFLELTDSPTTYSGAAGKSVVVNATEDGLEFTTISGGFGSSQWSDDVNGIYYSGNVGIGIIPDASDVLTTSGTAVNFYNTGKVSVKATSDTDAAIFRSYGFITNDGDVLGGLRIYNNNDSVAFLDAVRDGADDQFSWTISTQETGGGVTERMRITYGGQVTINDVDQNANMTIGLTINQGANDDEIVSLKSSNNNHGMTEITEADTFLHIKQASTGGTLMVSASPGDTAFLQYAAITTDYTTPMGGGGSLIWRARKKSGVNWGSTSSDNICFCWLNHNTALLNLDGAGNLYGEGKWFIGDTSNANMTVGLTINQGASDDEAIALKSSDVAHGITTDFETDTYGTLRKANANEGGLKIDGISEIHLGIALHGVVTTSNTDKTTTGAAPIMLYASQKSGTVKAGNLDANANVVGIRCYTGGGYKTVWIADVDGDTHQTGSIFVNEASNANMTIGLTINQGANDDEIFTLKSSDVGHPVTSLTETDTYFYIKKQSATQGGVSLYGITDDDIQPFILHGVFGTTDPFDPRGAVEVRGYKSDGGTGTTTLADTETIFNIRNNTLISAAFYGDGSAYIAKDLNVIGDITCNDIYTASGTVYIGSEQISSPSPGVLDFGGATIQNTTIPGTFGGGVVVFVRTIELTSTSGTLDFDDIPQTADNLVIVGSVRNDDAGTGNNAMAIRFNNDSTANYDSAYGGYSASGGLSSGVDGSNLSYMRGPSMPDANAPANKFSAFQMFIPEYKKTDRHKSQFAIGYTDVGTGTGDFLSQHSGGTWQSTSAITSIQLYGYNGGDFVAGSKITLYGISTSAKTSPLDYDKGRQELFIEYATTSGINILPGRIDIEDGSDEYALQVSGTLFKESNSLSASTWYYVYAKPPVSGNFLSESEIELSTTEPTRNVTKRGYYHGTNTTWRCFSAFYVNSGVEIQPFTQIGADWQATDDIINQDLNGFTSDSWTDVTFTVPFGNIFVLADCRGTYVNTYRHVYYRKNGDSGAGFLIITARTDNSRPAGFRSLPIDSDKKGEVQWSTSGSDLAYLNVMGFKLPDWIAPK